MNAVANAVSRLSMIQTPPAQGSRHRPVPHAALLAAIQEGLTDRGMAVKSARVETTGRLEIGNRLFEGVNMFGTLDVAPDEPDTYGAYDFSDPYAGAGRGFGFSLGFRSSNAQKNALQIVAGAHVFVCSNGVFVGDFRAVNRKHTRSMNLYDTVNFGLDNFMDQRQDVEREIHRQQDITLTDDRARATMLRMFETETLPLRFLRPMAGLYFAPDEGMTDVSGRNLFGLQSAATRLLRQEPEARRQRHTVELGKFLAMVN